MSPCWISYSQGSPSEHACVIPLMTCSLLCGVNMHPPITVSLLSFTAAKRISLITLATQSLVITNTQRVWLLPPYQTSPQKPVRTEDWTILLARVNISGWYNGAKDPSLHPSFIHASSSFYLLSIFLSSIHVTISHPSSINYYISSISHPS